MSINPNYRLRMGADRASSRSNIVVAVLIVLASIIAGLLTIVSADLAASKPALLLAVPMLIVLAVAFVLAPKMLIIGILLLRAGINPLFEGTQLPGIGGLGGMVNLAVILLALGLVVREPKRVPPAAWLIWLPLVLLQLAGVAYAPDKVPALRLFLGQLATMAMFVAAFHLVDDWTSFDRMLRLIVASSVPVAIYTLVAIARGDTQSSLEGMESTAGRYSGPFPHPNILAFYLVLVIGVLLYLWKNPRSAAGLGLKCSIVGYLLVLLALLFATKTRSAWISVAFLFFLYGLFIERRFLIYLAVAPMLAMLVPEVRDRILDLGQGNAVVQYARLNSFAWRKLIWVDGLTWMQPSHYLLGYGFSAFIYYSPTFFSMAGGHAFGAHSVFVQLFFELGIAGLCAYLWMFWRSFRMLIPIKADDRMAAVLFGALVSVYLVVSSSDNMLGYLVFNWYFWFLIGMVCALVSRLPSQGGAPYASPLGA